MKTYINIGNGRKNFQTYLEKRFDQIEYTDIKNLCQREFQSCLIPGIYGWVILKPKTESQLLMQLNAHGNHKELVKTKIRKGLYKIILIKSNEAHLLNIYDLACKAMEHRHWGIKRVAYIENEVEITLDLLLWPN